MTKLLYLDDTYLFESKAFFVEIKEHEKGTAVIVDQTIFYPQGGGQPFDIGTITKGENTFSVTDVRLDEDGIVWHFGEFTNGNFSAEDEVDLEIDSNRRLKHAKLHSAGHLLDCALTRMGITELIPAKGFHFSEGPYVECVGVLENANDMIPELQRVVDILVEEDLLIEKKNFSHEEAKQEGISAPEGKSARVVEFSGFAGCGCGGTHMNSSQEIGKITIRKMKSKKGVTKISYSVED